MRDGTLTIGVAWNGSGELSQLLDRAHTQAWVDEVLVAPSNEVALRKAEALMQTYPKLRCLTAGDTGIYSAYNKLIFGARTSHLCFHGADDFIVPDPRIGPEVRGMSADDLLVFNLRYCAFDGEFLLSSHHEERQPARTALGRHSSPATPEVVYPLAVIRAVGGADESFRIAGDADLYFRTRARARRKDLPIDFAEMRDGGASTAAKHAWTIYRENRRIAHRYGQRLTLQQHAKALLALGGRALLFRIGGESMSNEATDFFRRLAGRSPRFTRR